MQHGSCINSSMADALQHRWGFSIVIETLVLLTSKRMGQQYKNLFCACRGWLYEQKCCETGYILLQFAPERIDLAQQYSCTKEGSDNLDVVNLLISWNCPPSQMSFLILSFECCSNILSRHLCAALSSLFLSFWDLIWRRMVLALVGINADGPATCVALINVTSTYHMCIW